jgi:hypothetical protein
VTPLVLAIAAASAGLLLAGVAGVLIPPRSRLAGRVRPYTLVTRAGLGRSADAFTVAAPQAADRSTLGRLFGPPIRAGSAASSTATTTPRSRFGSARPDGTT